MAPDGTGVTGVLYESDAATADLGIASRPVFRADNIKWTYQWHFIILFAFLHAGALYGAFLFFVSAKWQTDIFAVFLYVVSILGITAAAHRLWTHKAFKAKWPLQLILVIFNTMSVQFSVIDWVRRHRTHHKYSDTDADPSNASRGFFFSHVGWLFVNEHPEYLRKSKEVDLSDLYSDPIVRFQDKYYWALVTLLSFFLPTVIPIYCWDESWVNAFFVAVIFRSVASLNAIFCINSFAHMSGDRPYDGTMKPSETFIYRLVTLGEGAHNYHHTFPWDYKTSEFCTGLDGTTYFIDLFAKIGWAYDLKTVSEEIIQKRVRRTGDGSHALWGWGDKDQSQEEMNAAIRINPKDD